MGWWAVVALFGHPRLDPGSDRRKGRAIFQSSGKFSPMSARFASRGVLDMRGTSGHGRTRKPGSDDLFVHRMKEPDEGWHGRIM